MGRGYVNIAVIYCVIKEVLHKVLSFRKPFLKQSYFISNYKSYSNYAHCKKIENHEKKEYFPIILALNNYCKAFKNEYFSNFSATKSSNIHTSFFYLAIHNLL